MRRDAKALPAQAVGVGQAIRFSSAARERSALAAAPIGAIAAACLSLLALAFVAAPAFAAAPAVSGTVASQITDTTATLNAQVNPEGEATTYHFEYVDDAHFQVNGYTDAISLPVPDAGIGAGSSPVAIGKDVTGLQPATTYHFHLIATNGTGPTEGPDQTFLTYPLSHPGLPDNRAYELVSPEDTNGTAVTGSGTGIFNGFDTWLAAPSGNSVIFFAQPPDSGGNGFFDQYESVRTDSGWESSPISPSGAQSEKPNPGGTSTDHRYTFWTTGESPFDHGSLQLGTARTQYVRNPDGSYALIGQGSLGNDPVAQGKRITAGASHIIFTSKVRLEESAPAAGITTVYDRTPMGTHVVSLLPGDLPPASNATYQGVSSDGSAVVFKIGTTMYERRNNATLTVAAGTTTYAGVSQDGGRAFYVQSGNIFVFDANSLTTTPITSGGGATVVNVSVDGSHVYFASTQQLDGSKGTLGAKNFYVWDGATVRFIAVLDPSDFTAFGGSNLINLGKWTTAVGPVQTGGSGPEVDPSRTNPDGTVLAFQSHASLTSYDSGGHSEVYRFDDEEPDQAKQLTCVSCSPIGAAATSEAELAPNISDESRKTNMLAHTENVSDDGQTVFFQSRDPLVPGDVNGTTDVYEWKEGRVSLISSGHSATPNRIYGMTPDGHDVFFTTDEALVPEDHTGSAGAIYDARVDGGFSPAVVGLPCVEDACQGSPSAPPILPAAASGSFQGPGNVQPHRKKRHHKKHHRRHRHKARHNSGGAK